MTVAGFPTHVAYTAKFSHGGSENTEVLKGMDAHPRVRRSWTAATT